MEDEMPLLKYFRSLRGRYRRTASTSNSRPEGAREYLDPGMQRDESQAARKLFADQETTHGLGGRKGRGKLKKHISGIFII
jgi:hypothetical protein